MQYAMQLSNELKERTLTAILADRANYPSDSKHATAIGISSSVYSTIKKGKLDKQLSDSAWLSLARRLNVPLRGEIEWKVAKTDTYSYITSQLEACQERSLSALLCDIPNIGKTFSARHYARTHKHVVYIDCSQTKTKVWSAPSLSALAWMLRGATKRSMLTWSTTSRGCISH